MKFSTTTTAFLAALFLAQSAEGFSVGPMRTAMTTPGHSQSLAFRSSPLYSAPPTAEPELDHDVQRLKSMAAKLRAEAAELEADKAQERAQAAERAFQKFDTSGDGEITLDELKSALEKTLKMDLPEARVEKLMSDFDTSGDGKLQLEEFRGIEQFRNKLESYAREEKRAANDAVLAAKREQEESKFLEAQLELINDKPPTATDKLVSVLPYFFPLMDGLMFGQFLLGTADNPAVTALAVMYTIYRSIPFSGFISFLALNVLSGNLSINKLVRYNMQQAIYLDIALFIPGLLGTLGAAAANGLGVQIPEMAAQLGSDAIFFSLIAAIGYATASSLLGVTPDKVPFISDRVSDRMSLQLFDDQGNLLYPRDSNVDKRGDDEENKRD